MQRKLNRAAMEMIVKERLDLAERKFHDYQAEMDGIAIGGPRGIAVRLIDKVARALALTRPGFEAQVTDEALEDTFKDLATYAEYAILLLRKQWRPEMATLQSIIASHIDDKDARTGALELLAGL